MSSAFNPFSALWLLFLQFVVTASILAETIKLTNLEGKVIEAEVLSLKDGKAEILFDGKKTTYPVDQLNEESRTAVVKAAAARNEKLASAKAERMVLPDGQKIVPGRMHSVTLKASDKDREWLKSEELKEVLLSVSFPQGFDPDKPWPVFFVNDTTQGANAKVTNAYVAGGSELGYVVIGAQATVINDKNKLNSWDARGIVTFRAIHELSQKWPDILESDWYYGGNSGGSKNCCYLAVYLYETYKKAAGGFYISSSNEMKMLDAIQAYKSEKNPFRKTAFFVSNGQSDKIATPEQGKKVADEYEGAPFGEVRFEIHDGGHEMSQAHYREALKWFTQLRSGR